MGSPINGWKALDLSRPSTLADAAQLDDRAIGRSNSAPASDTGSGPSRLAPTEGRGDQVGLERFVQIDELADLVQRHQVTLSAFVSMMGTVFALRFVLLGALPPICR